MLNKVAMSSAKQPRKQRTCHSTTANPHNVYKSLPGDYGKIMQNACAMRREGEPMSIVGFNFTKISAERKQAVVGNISISNNISLKEVKEAKIGMGDRGAVRVSFAFTSTYSPNYATLLLEGDVLVLVDSKQTASIIDGWNKNKNLPPQLAGQIMNHTLDRCNIQALLLSKDLNLPSPVPLPKVNVNAPQTADTKADDVKATKVKKK